MSLGTLVMILFAVASSQTTDKKSNAEEVAFLITNPIVDGRLDAGLEELEEREFKHFWQFDNPQTDPVRVTYRLAYTTSHLYVYIETGANRVSYHRRGYVWGDGYKLLLGIPQEDSLTDQYYELTYSPSEEKSHWDRQRIESYNFKRAKRSFSADSRSQEAPLGNRCGFEALIAWSDIDPYHPWLLDEIGYNLYFAKGIASQEHGYFTNGYAVVEDEGIWDEEIPRRNVQPLEFQEPSTTDGSFVLARPKERHLGLGESINLEIASFAARPSTAVLTVSVADSASRIVAGTDLTFEIQQQLRRQEIRLPQAYLSPGKYDLTVTSPTGGIRTFDLVVFPRLDFDQIASGIARDQHSLGLGTVNTLTFELRQIQEKLGDLERYEAGTAVFDTWRAFDAKYETFSSGTDPYKRLREPYRRAFRSQYDETYQPYSLKLPEDYDPENRYPLLVFLHGSGQDDQGLLDRARSNGKFIEIAPLARDKFRAYSSSSSQNDILEAIEDVSTHFSVDRERIVVGGFSMGGYGALRTYYEHPELYKGVAVFAGHPNLASEWLDEEHPNFLEDRYLSPFAGIPVFIYHGRKDPAVPVGLMEKTGSKLQAAGARVTSRIIEDKAHEYPDEGTNRVYFDWLDSLVTTN